MSADQIVLLCIFHLQTCAQTPILPVLQRHDSSVSISLPKACPQDEYPLGLSFIP